MTMRDYTCIYERKAGVHMSPSCFYLSYIHLSYIHHPTIYMRNYTCIYERKAGVYMSPLCVHLSYMYDTTTQNIRESIRAYMKGRAGFT